MLTFAGPGLFNALLDRLNIVPARISFGSDGHMVRPQIVQVLLRALDGIEPRRLDNIEEHLDRRDSRPLAQVAQVFSRSIAKERDIFLRREPSQIRYKVPKGSSVVFIIEHPVKC